MFLKSPFSGATLNFQFQLNLVPRVLSALPPHPRPRCEIIQRVGERRVKSLGTRLSEQNEYIGLLFIPYYEDHATPKGFNLAFTNI